MYFSFVISGADLGGGCRGCAPPSPRDHLRFSNTTGILQKKKLCGLLKKIFYSKKKKKKKKKKTVWFIGVEVDQGTTAPPPKKFLDPPLWCKFNVYIIEGDVIGNIALRAPSSFINFFLQKLITKANH